MTNYNITTIIKDPKGLPIVNLIVEIWDRRTRRNALLGKGRTDTKGRCNILFSTKISTERNLTLQVSFKLWKDDQLIGETPDRELVDITSPYMRLTLKVGKKVEVVQESFGTKRIGKNVKITNARQVSQLYEVLDYIAGEGHFVTQSPRGKLTEKAIRSIKKIQRKHNLNQSGELDPLTLEAINSELITRKYKEPEQISQLQKSMQRLDYKIKREELIGKRIGDGTKTAIQEFQRRYKLPVTGEMNPETEERIQSVIASKYGTRPEPVKIFKFSNPAELSKVRYPLRLNMQKEPVNDLQRALAWMGFEISQSEVETRQMGATTRNAVKGFQKKYNLPLTGEVDSTTARKINSRISQSSSALSSKEKYRVRGSVRDSLWKGKVGVKVEVYEKGLRQVVQKLGEQGSFRNGFYDILYAPPINPDTGKVKESFHLEIRVVDAGGNLLDTSLYYNASQVIWANFTQGNEKYQGDSEFDAQMRLLKKSLGGLSIGDIEESVQHRDVHYLYEDTGIPMEQIMKLSLSHRISGHMNHPDLSPEAIFSFLRQNLPPELPDDIAPDPGSLEDTSLWAGYMTQLVEKVSLGLVFLEKPIQLRALENAIESNFVPRIISVQKTKIIDTLQDFRKDYALKKPLLVGDGNLSALLQTASITDEGKQKLIAEYFVSNQGVNKDFWDTLDQDNSLSAQEIDRLKTTVDLGVVAKNNIPTVKFLLERIKDPLDQRINAARDTAKLNLLEWVTLINENGGTVPSNIDGPALAVKVDVFAQTMMDQAELLFPTVSFVTRVKEADIALFNRADEVANLVYDNDAIDLRSSDFDIIAGELAVPAEVLSQVKVLQRIRRLAPTTLTGVALLKEGLHSSSQIYFKGKDRLVESLLKNPDIERSQAERVYKFAETQYANVLAKIGQYRFDLLRGNPSAISTFTYSKLEIETFKQEIPNIESLFGSLDYCECKHCRSVYSPSAYLADLLRFLELKDSLVPNQSVFDVLVDRRPDLGNILLSCENTKTPMPYIDLVNEVLEHAIPLPETRDFTLQSSLPAEELRAIPEHILIDAYELLKKAHFPISGHFNLWQESARVLLNHLGISRYTLMEHFQNKTIPLPSDVSIAAEYFGVSTQEAQKIINPELNVAVLSEYWGFDVTQTEIFVDLFLIRAQLKYSDLLELLQVRFVNPEDNKSQVLRPVDDCDTSVQKINLLNPAKLDKMYRFLRFWRRTPWKMWELDQLIRSAKIGNGLLNNVCLINLQRVHDIQYRLKSSPESIRILYDDFLRENRISIEPYGNEIPNLYDSLFLNKTVTNPIDAAFVDPDNNAPLEVRSDHEAAILAALTITDADLSALNPKLPDNNLTESHLSYLYRYAHLAKKLKLSVTDLLTWMDILDVNDPFLTPQDTLVFLEKMNQVKHASFSLNEFEYVRRFAFDSSVGVRKETVTQYFNGLRNDLQKISDGIFKTPGSLREVTTLQIGKFSKFEDSEILEKALDLIEGKWPLTNAERETFIQDHFVFIQDIPNAKAQLSGPVVLTEAQITVRYNFVLTALFAYLKETSIIEKTGNNLGLSVKHISVLMQNLNLGGAGPVLITYYNELLNKDAVGDFIPLKDAHYLVYHLLHKCKILIHKFKIADEDLAWYIQNKNALELIDLSLLPVQTIDALGMPIQSGNNSLPFVRWEHWYELQAFKLSHPEPEGIQFFNILGKAINNDASVFADLVLLIQMDSLDLSALSTGLGWTTADFAKGKTYGLLEKCLSDIRGTSVSVQMMFDWANRDSANDVATSSQIMQAVKSKYESQEWLKQIGPLQDKLREKKRTSLADFLIELSQRPANVTIDGQVFNNSYQSMGWEDKNDLFTFFLIDVEMSACMLTSRLKQAISSVQLFVQRCFLNLEADFVKIPNDDPDIENSWTQWKWMKHYRIWEANRKVFLYPENWIEPELRDDKSPFFSELESELRQNELTTTNAEAAFLSYLQKADEVSRLEITGVYHELEGSVKRFHVVGRTSDQAPNYFYRYYDLQYNTWSPWERVESDITGEHLIPVVYNRKVYLFWLVFLEKPVKLKRTPPAKASDSPGSNPEQPKVLEIQLAWTVRGHKGWSAKKISKRKLIHPWDRPHFAYNLRPRYRASDNSLLIDLFISTSHEFNNTLFYDQFSAKPVKMSEIGHNEVFRPWHSSSFVFDGEVRDIKLKGIAGVYYLGSSQSLVRASSYQYLQENFGEEGRKITPLKFPDKSPSLRLPSGMHFENTRLVNNMRDNRNIDKMNIIEPTGTKTLLRSAKAPFEVVQSMQSLSYRPLFYQDARRSFFVKPEFEEISLDYQTKIWRRKYVFYPFYHPYTDMFIRELNRSGLDGFFKRKIQVAPHEIYPKNTFNFNSSYLPVAPHEGHATTSKDIVDFTLGGAYSIYNWEAFFHAPLMIATLLNQNQRFEESMHWFHYIFDPTNTENLDTPQRFWITKPFHEQSDTAYKQQRISEILQNIDEHADLIKAWINDPFKPHLIARYRPVAYQRNVVMRYIKNLIDWGDMLFRRDSIESINEATQLYVLAKEILGHRPDKVPGVHRTDKTYNELTADRALDLFGNQEVEVIVENMVGMPVSVVESTGGVEPLPHLDTLYFCIPRNDKLDGYWDLVEDRLYKIRNCMNIQGIVRQLRLFEPPIDPALLVKAAAHGLDLSSVLNDISAPAPHYRFRILAQKASEFCSEVKALGEKLLGTLEKRDAEALSLLRQDQELQMLEAVAEIRKLQIEEAKENLDGLERSQAVIEERYDYYANIEKLNSFEETHLSKLQSSQTKQEVAQGLTLAASIISLIPDIDLGASGFGGSPVAKFKIGGLNLGQAAKLGADILGYLSMIDSNSATMASIKGGNERRWEDWKFQERIAEKELRQMEKQIAASEIRLQIVERENENHAMQIDHSKAVQEYLKNKYTNEQLYTWMIGEVSTIYFQSYQRAYEMAKRAERSLQHELGVRNTSYIQFGYWDSLKNGLLAGDKLSLDIRRMESAFIDQHTRELEITKHISLSQLAPQVLLELKTTGRCELSLPEWLYNMDYPGHYNRRIKSVSLSIPCITGPYTSINCTLSLKSSAVRINNLVGSGYERDPANPDDRFYDQLGTIQSIATSHGQQDSGMFQLNFADERFLPFEGSGAISDWIIDLPIDNNQFDFATVSDVILHVGYTSKDGGASLASAARSSLNAILPNAGMRLLNVKTEFPSSWHQFFHPDPDGSDQKLVMKLKVEHFPFFARNKTISIVDVSFIFDGADGIDYVAELSNVNLVATEIFDPISPDPQLGNFHRSSKAINPGVQASGDWTIKLKRKADGDFKSLPVGEIHDLFILLKYNLS